MLRKFCEHFMPDGPYDNDHDPDIEIISVDVVVATEKKRNIKEGGKLGSPDSWGKHIHPDVAAPPEPPNPDDDFIEFKDETDVPDFLE